MDSLLASLDSVRVTFDEVDTFTKHPLFSLYKNNYKRGSQEARRSKYLDEQKKRRVDTFNCHRGLDFKNKADEESFQENAEKLQSRQHNGGSWKQYGHLLMMNEWLTDVPDDFTEWIAVPCPANTRRMLIVAERGCTFGYSRRGKKILNRFPSALPGGSTSNRIGTTILDTLWDGSTIMIVDVIQWGIPDITRCSSEFRFTWIYWKCSENESSYSVASKMNRYPIKPLDRFPCSMLPKYASRPPEIKLDGIMFYHRDGLYETEGRSPLVTWLKPHMLCELLPSLLEPNQVDDYFKSPPEGSVMDTTDNSNCDQAKTTSATSELNDDMESC